MEIFPSEFAERLAVFVIAVVLMFLIVSILILIDLKKNGAVECEVFASDEAAEFAKQVGIEDELSRVVSNYNGKWACSMKRTVILSDTSPVVFRFEKITEDKFAVIISWH